MNRRNKKLGWKQWGGKSRKNEEWWDRKEIVEWRYEREYVTDIKTRVIWEEY